MASAPDGRCYAGAMTFDAHICYRAVEQRDARFDGRFFTAVRTTGIYCRPVCPAPTPKEKNCTFYPSAAAAEQAGFRACRRCRPETAPGSPVWVGVETTVHRALRLIEDGALDEGSVGMLADRLGVGERHLRRLFADHLGTTPTAVAVTQRLHMAKRLVDGTDLPMSDIALAAGFQSLRRFNDAYLKSFHRSPTASRKAMAEDGDPPPPAGGDGPAGVALTVTLAYRPPFAWDRLLRFLRQRTLEGIETSDETGYARTIRTPDGPGMIAARFLDGHNRIAARLVLPTARSLRPVVRRLKALFDLDADSAAIDAAFTGDGFLGAHAAQVPGVRVPGTWDVFEFACRAVIGQQVSEKGARTVARRLAERLGDPLPQCGDAMPGLSWLFPTPEAVAEGDLSALGMPDKRAAALRPLARAFIDGPLRDMHSLPPDDARAAIAALPGLGPWTAETIAMRALGDPDAFPGTDLGVLKVLNLDLSAGGRKALQTRAEAWRPWRAYATIRLWTMLLEPA